MGKVTNLDNQQKFIELRSKGHSFNEISKLLVISKPTLIKWSKDLEVEINNQKTIEEDSMRISLGLYREHRIETLGNQLNSIKDELKSRNFKNIPTSQLIKLYILINTEVEKMDKDMMFYEIDNNGISTSVWDPVKIGWSAS